MNLRSALQRFLREERGQVLPVIAIMAVGLMGLAGMVIDVGHLYVSYNELQASTNAAALAGAQALPNSTAVTIATQYSGTSGNLNARGNLPGVTMVSGYPEVYCLSSIQAAQPCIAPANGNVLIVKQQVPVKMFFASLFGFKTFTLTASAAASMRGGYIPPYNVAIIIDATKSMNDTDSSNTCNNTRISCALSGVSMLLNELYPCASYEASCGTATNGVVANSVDNVSFFSFPAVSQSTVADDYNCGSKSPTNEPYTFPTAGASSYAPSSSTATYQIVGFSSDYRTSDIATSLNTASKLVIASGGKSGCNAMVAVGGEGTYIAGTIYAAQSALIAQQKSNPASQNVIILLSDGDAGTTTSGALSGASTTSGTYPSTQNQCQQYVTAAQAATAAGTRVYTVAYGAESSGCTPELKGSSITPCQAMQQSASSALTFFSDYAATGGDSTCQSAARPTTSLNQIFVQIGGDFSTSRLVPMSSIPGS